MRKKAQPDNQKTTFDTDRRFIGGTVSKAGLLTLLVIGVSIIVVTAHWPILSSKVLFFDDNSYLVENPLVKNPSWQSTKRFFAEVRHPSTVRGYYQPLSMVSLMFDYALGGRADNLKPFRITSLILHVANTCLVGIVLYQLFGNVFAAVIAGLIFGVHPAGVECIGWLAERKALLACFFSLLSLIAYLRFAGRKNKTAYILCVVFFILALLSKPTSVPLPIVMILLDYWPLKRFSRKTLAEKIPFLVLSAFAALITFISQAVASGVVTPSSRGGLKVVMIICHNIVFYIYKFLWPVTLYPRYMFPDPFTLSNPAVSAGVIGTIFLLAALLISLRWTRAFLTGWLIFFILLAPAIGIIGFTDVIAADRFLYQPAIGMLMILAWLLKRFCPASISNLSRRDIAVTAAAVLLLAGEAAATRRYLSHWSDTISLYRYSLAICPDDPLVNDNLGAALAQQGRLDEAIGYLARAVKLNPKNANAHSNLALAFTLKGRAKQAIFYYRNVLKLSPNDQYALINLAWIFATDKDARIRNGPAAVELAEKACKLNSYKDPRMLDILAMAYAENGNFPEAVRTSQKAINICISAGQTQLAKQISARRQLYKAGKTARAN
jgi:Flp pilus assembly protein TadD